MSKLNVKIGDLELKNPVMLASGTCSLDLRKFTDLSKVGAVITKSVTLEPRLGNLPPRTAETCGGMLNSIGIENPGVNEFMARRLPQWLEIGVPVIVSVAGRTEDEYVEIVTRLDQTEVGAFEINVSCPNVEGVEFCKNPQLLKELVAATRKATEKTLIVKLSPNVSNMQEVALTAEQAGADAVSLINTIYGLKIDLETRTSMLGATTGGLSGPCIKPTALYYVYKVSQVCKIPIIGLGGIMNVQDALEFLVVGATAVQIGTATFVNPDTAINVVQGIRQYCQDEGIESVQELIGSRKFQ
jgi:dihydroorotate dehydrogenase (NAD+) catalytic subunit